MDERSQSPGHGRPVYPGDYHVHTTFSDGSDDVAACVAHALAVGLPEIGIADHLSPVQPTPWDSGSVPLELLGAYIAEVRWVADRHDDIVVLLAVEADYVPEHEERLRAFLSAHAFDYVIGGVHVVDGFEFDDPAQRNDPRWADTETLFLTYYERVRAAAQSGCFDVIAHLDYIGLWGHRPTRQARRACDEVLDAMAAAGCALELNTDRISDPAGVMYPADEVLAAARSRGIALVIDSDAHEARHVGRLWDEAIGRARRAGYRETLRLSDRAFVPLP